MIASFHPEAQQEFYAAIDYYEECRATLGYDFAREVYAAKVKAQAEAENKQESISSALPQPEPDPEPVSSIQ